MNETPPHPGTVLRLFLQRNSIAQEALSSAMCVSRPLVNHIVMGKKGLSPNLIIRLAYATGMPEEYWAGVQMTWALWRQRQHMSGVFPRMTRLSTKGDLL